ncbi:DUF3073 domain-containing protein [Ancrocorticia populi]|uniref:DUF3073 domain-containing protein n=1 Tax=Ancrocorticia populi TaxID=2175228 RepID=A0A2V1KAU0_9ACTO|nr:DUF3073 domain-containing protein [Ancrocorticia populi]MDN6486852.1 DUF3073 domain-containing protein [Ancrocorticia sp.]PWF26071.1 DUF3073 domain-containing protein [Ancrocorticia populi]
MGRGRQKAKQRKVARNLKYYTPETDYQALERELRGQKASEEDEDYEDYYDVPSAEDAWDEDEDGSSKPS